MFVDDSVSVPVRYGIRGISEGKVDIVLSYDGREVAAKRDIPVKEGDDLKEVLTFVPQKSDAAVKKQELTATITVTSMGRVQTESLSDSITKPSQVVDKKLKVLVVDSLPRYDFKYLQPPFCAIAASRPSSTSPRGTSRRCGRARPSIPRAPTIPSIPGWPSSPTNSMAR